MRTDQEILDRLKAIEAGDIFGTEQSDLLARLPFAAARPFLVDDAEEVKWVQQPRDRESVLEEMADYMPFAWEKANHCRGLSAMRSLMHMAAWLWLIGEDGAATAIGNYDYYGKPQLRAICEHYNWDWTVWDEGWWRTNEGEEGVPPRDAAELPWSQADGDKG